MYSTFHKAALAAVLLASITAAHAAEFGRGWWHGRYVTYKIRNGLAIYQGDIILGRAADIPADPPAPKAGLDAKSAAFLTGLNNTALWPSGIVPYDTSPSFTGALATVLNQAIANYASNTPIRWTRRASESNYVYFDSEPADSSDCGNSNSIGVLGGVQHININVSCANLATMVHEMGHAIGFEHEQTRTDRDYYVKVHFENMDKNETSQYDRDPGQIDVLPYNQASIMHYSPYDFMRGTLNTMETIPPGIPISHRNSLSAGDIEAIRTIYGLPSSTTTIYTDPAGLPVIIDGQSVKTPVTLNWVKDSRHTLDIAPGFQMTNNPLTRYVFARWSNDGPQSQTVIASPQTRIIGANFSTRYLLSTAIGNGGGGTVAVNPPSPDGYYTLGTVVTVTATPAAGFGFLQWDDPAAISSYHGVSSNPATFTVNFPAAYTADFTRSPITAITTNIPGTLATIDTTDILLPASFAWAPGTNHTVSVSNTVQDNGSIGSPYRWAFQSWSDGGATTHTVTAGSASATLAASWQQRWLVSTYTADPANPYGTLNGLLTVSPKSTECGNPTPTDCYYPAGTRLTLTPTPVAPFEFAGWSGDLSGYSSPGSLAVDDQVFLTANFANPGRLVRAAIVNAANYQAQGVAPGEVITVFGLRFGPPAQLTGAQVNGNRLATTLAQTQLLFDGTPAPLIYVSANQISAIVPYEVAGKTTTRMAISYQGRSGNAVNVNVVPSHPGLFSLDASGSGLVAALNQNNSIHGVNNPAPRGSVIQLFGTGMGVTKPGSVTGQIVAPPFSGPALPFQVLIAGRVANVFYFGGAPGLASGVFQANVVVPADCPAGLVPISVTVGSMSSPATTRIAVQ